MGRYNWGVFEDTHHKGQYIEHFMEDSWAEHLRHHDRVTHSDVPLQDAVKAFQRGETPPKADHYLAAHLKSKSP